jgi:uncharacterized membrane protein
MLNRSRRLSVIALAWLMTQWRVLLVAFVVLASILTAVGAVAYVTLDEKERRQTRTEREAAATQLASERRHAFALSTVQNCLQIEALKDGLRAAASALGKGRPEDRALRLALERFAPMDCYQQPAALAAGLKPERGPIHP